MPTITPQTLPTDIIAETKNRQPDIAVDPASVVVDTPPQKDEGASKLADLARKEKALVQKMREIAAKEAALSAKEPELRTSTEAAFKDSLKARISEDPLGFLAEYGVSQELLTQFLLNPPAPLSPEVKKMRDELNQLKQQQTDSQKAQEEQRSSAYQQAVKQVRDDVTNLIDNDERFETVKAMSAHDAVSELIVQTYEKTKKLISSEEAATQVEEYLLNESIRVANLPKVQSKLKPQDPAPPQAGSTQPKTITNRAETSPARGPLTSRQRIENAIAAGEGRPKPH